MHGEREALVLELGHVRLIGGKQAINVLPDAAPNKGVALVLQRARLGCDFALYCGDDETDEDVFALAEPEHVLTIRVGASRRSRAQYYLRSQTEIDALLRELVGAREQPSRSPAEAHAVAARTDQEQ